MWELDCKESWAPKNWCFWTALLEKTLESPLDCKEIQPVHPKGNQSWMFIGRTDIEAETPILWPPDAKNWLIWKDPGAGKDWRREEKGTTEGEVVGWHHWRNAVSLSKCWDMKDAKDREAGVLQSLGSQRIRCGLATEQWEIAVQPPSGLGVISGSKTDVALTGNSCWDWLRGGRMAWLGESYPWFLHLLRQQILFKLPGSIRACVGNGIQSWGQNRSSPCPPGENRHDSSCYEWKEMTDWSATPPSRDC